METELSRGEEAVVAFIMVTIFPVFLFFVAATFVGILLACWATEPHHFR